MRDAPTGGRATSRAVRRLYALLAASALSLGGGSASAAVEPLVDAPCGSIRAQLPLLPDSMLPALTLDGGLLAKRRFRHPEEHVEDDASASSRAATNGTGRYAHRFFEFGLTVGPESPALAAGAHDVPTAIGLHFADNDIILGRLFFILVGAAARTQTHVHTGSSYHTDGSGNVWRVDSYRRLSPRELAERDAAIEEAIEGRYIGELNVWIGGKERGTQGWEYRVGDTMPLNAGPLPVLGQIGLVLAHVSTTHVGFRGGEGFAPTADGQPWVGSLYYSNIGVFLRVLAPITPYLEASATWDLNLMQLLDNAENRAKGYRFISPLRASLALNLSDSFYLKHEWMLPALSLDAVRWSLALGGRL